MGMIGLPEMAIIFGIVIILFGVKRLPEIGKNLGEGIKNFKWSMKQITTDENGDDR